MLNSIVIGHRSLILGGSKQNKGELRTPVEHHGHKEEQVLPLIVYNNAENCQLCETN